MHINSRPLFGGVEVVSARRVAVPISKSDENNGYRFPMEYDIRVTDGDVHWLKSAQSVAFRRKNALGEGLFDGRDEMRFTIRDGNQGVFYKTSATESTWEKDLLPTVETYLDYHNRIQVVVERMYHVAQRPVYAQVTPENPGIFDATLALVTGVLNNREPGYGSNKGFWEKLTGQKPQWLEGLQALKRRLESLEKSKMAA